MIYDDKSENEIKALLIKRQLEEGSSLVMEDLDGIHFEIEAYKYIGHIDNMENALEKLADIENSPIADEGYTGINIYELNTSGTRKFDLEIGYFLEMLEQIKTFLMVEGIDENIIDFISIRCKTLNKLGFGSMALIADPVMADIYKKEQLKIIKRKEQEEKEANEEHYNISDYMMIPEDNEKE